MAEPESGHLASLIRAIQLDPVGEAASESMRRLEPFIQQTARRVCLYLRVTRQLEDDLVSGAPGLAWEKMKYFDDSRGEFTGWLWTLLEHRLKDEQEGTPARKPHEPIEDRR